MVMQRIAIIALAATAYGLAAGSAWATPALLLDRAPERVAQLEVAPNNRDTVEQDIPVPGPWHIVHTIDGVRTWEAPIPIRPRTLFFHRAPKGMKLIHVGSDDGKTKTGRKILAFGAGVESSGKNGSWNFTSRAVRVRRSIADPAPNADEYRFRYPRAVEREQALNRSLANIEDDMDFVFRSVQIDDTNRRGLYLPAPSSITFNVDVPEAAVLTFDARIIPPEAGMPSGHSDGAQLLISIKDGDTSSALADLNVTRNEVGTRLDLTPWAGKSIQMEFKTEGQDNPELDYVFIAEPTVYTPQEDPPRVVMVFIDTLRPDHMSVYGYERETSPHLDAWSKDAAVFTQARSIAPWTLPSARTMLTGTHPERWDKTARLPDLFAASGWATGFIAGNVYLSSNFEMAEGWGTHRCINWPQGSVQIDRGLSFLDKNHDRPAFLLLHLMDMHLPYTEPVTYRYKFAGETPTELGQDDFLRNTVTRRAKSEATRQHIRDRYDNNMAYLDDQLTRVLGKLGSQDTVVILSDHGEEFWDHGGFEHGHSLYDELLRIPMILKGPGVTPGQFDEPVSLLDVAPTLAKMAELGTMGMVGDDLRTLADGSQTSRFANRPQAFGRPLYGLRQWGSLSGDMKYISAKGTEKLFDLSSDPEEKTDLAKTGDLAQSRTALSTALERPVIEAWRMVPDRDRNGKPIRVTVHTDATTSAWAGDDPTMSGRARVEIDSHRVVARWPKQRGLVEVFVVPPNPWPDTLEIDFRMGDKTSEATIDLGTRITPDPGLLERLHKERLAGRSVDITTAWTPVPSDIDAAIAGFDSEVAGDLESLGYVGD